LMALVVAAVSGTSIGKCDAFLLLGARTIALL
jgi:hypothetical protein